MQKIFYKNNDELCLVCIIVYLNNWLNKTFHQGATQDDLTSFKGLKYISCNIRDVQTHFKLIIYKQFLELYIRMNRKILMSFYYLSFCVIPVKAFLSSGISLSSTIFCNIPVKFWLYLMSIIFGCIHLSNVSQSPIEPCAKAYLN